MAAPTSTYLSASATKERAPCPSTPLLSSASTPSDPPPAYETFGADKHPSTRHSTMKVDTSHNETLLFASFWLFGTVVVMQFGVVVTAANDLVGHAAPPGLILFAYTLPSIIVRMFVPYIKFPDLKRLGSWRNKYTRLSSSTAGPSFDAPSERSASNIDYTARLSICAASSFIGLQLLAWCDCIGVRILGIALASLSSNLGDMSFFQLATRYPAMITQSMGGYAAGSGAAGLIGSFIYTLLTGASVGASPSSVLSGVGLVPCVMLLVYFFVLPPPCGDEAATGKPSIIGELGLSDKLRLVKSMVWGYMAPLAVLMFLENVTTQGILPTILYHLPLSAPLSTLFNSTRDFYPFFFTTYQSAVFLGRTSINFFRLPGHNRGSSASYWVLAGIEVVCMLSLLAQSLSMAVGVSAVDLAAGVSPDINVHFSLLTIAGFIFLMGLCGGLGMSGTYWRVSKKPLPEKVWIALDAAICALRERHEEDGIWSSAADTDPLRGSSPFSYPNDEQSRSSTSTPRPRLRKNTSDAASMSSHLAMFASSADGMSGTQQKRWSQEEETAVREFLISTIALPDVTAIFIASVLSLWIQPTLCELQVQGGRGLCMEG